MQYHSLRHRTLLPSPVTFTARCCFCFVSISSFFHFSTLLQWHIGHLTTWAVHLSMPYIFAFSYCSWGSQGKNTEVVCHSLLQYMCTVRWVQLCGSLNILWHCLSLWLGRKLTFSSPVATAEFSKFAGILSAALSQHHILGYWGTCIFFNSGFLGIYTQ